MNKKVLVIAVALMAVVISASSIVPAFAKKFPEGALIAYYTGGEGNLVQPMGFPFPAPMLRIGALEIEASIWGTGDDIGIFIGTGTGWIPIAYFTTNQNPEYLTFLKALWALPWMQLNTKSVSEDELMVERHGNRITASLAEQDVKKMVSGVWTTVTILAFTMELNKVGGSVHSDYSIETPLYTINLDRMGFNGNGVFTYGGAGHEMFDEFIIMHGIETLVPTS
jgi:hypothetical protein